MRYWENNGEPMQDGRLCLVIDPEDGTNPIRTYGRTRDEVLEKVAKTAETAQAMINRQRSSAQNGHAVTPAAGNGTAPVPPSVTQATAPRRVPVSADEVMQATLDMQNPAKAPQAVKTLMRANGFDVDAMQFREKMQEIANLAAAWERQHPEFPASDRNNRMLMDKAALMAGGIQRVTTEALDAAYRELAAHGMLFDVEENNEPPAAHQAAQPEGNPAVRVVRPRGATSIRANSLRATAPAANPKPKYTRAEIDSMNTKQFREKYETEPGFAEWYNREFSSATA